MPQNRVRRLTDSARDVLAVVDNFGHGWEGGTSRDNRTEVFAIGAAQGSTVNPPTAANRWGVWLALGGLVLLLAWKG